MTVYKAAVIGCGNIGSIFADTIPDDVFSHADAYTECSGTKLTAICDVDIDRLSECGERWRIPREGRYQSASNLMEQKPDIVSICTPNDTHHTVALQVLQSEHRPKVIFIEKPLAITVAHAQEIVNLAQKHSVVLAVNYGRRYAANVQAVEKYIARGGIGNVIAVSGWYIGGILHNGTHWIDLLRFLVGPVYAVRVFGRLGSAHDVDLPVGAVFYLQYPCTAVLQNVNGVDYTVFEMDIMGTHGRIRLTDSCHKVEICLAQPSRRYKGYTELYQEELALPDRRHMTLHAVEDLVEVLEGKRPAPYCTGADGLRAVRIACAVTELAYGIILEVEEEYFRYV